MARSLNRAQLIGNLTRDPELRYTPNGTAVCSFGLATNRSWKTETGEKREEAEFHNIVAWNKLAELCSQFLLKGRKVFVEGRLATRTWAGQDGAQRNRTEIVISDMILLDSRGPSVAPATPEEPRETKETKGAEEKKEGNVSKGEDEAKGKTSKISKEKKGKEDKEASKEEVAPEDIPF